MKHVINISKFKIFVILTILWIILIFSFSLQPAEVSSEVSSGLGEWLVETLAPGLKQELEEMPFDQQEFCHFLLRKCAHFTEYMILGVFVTQTLLQIRLRLRALPSLLCCVMVAFADETIQLFVDGRSGQLMDVLLDSTGAATGILLTMLFIELIASN